MPPRGLFLLTALLVSACDLVPPTGSEVPTASGVPGGEPGQVLRMSYAELGSLDPTVSTDGAAMHLLVRGLTGLDDQMRTIPALAETWDVTAEGQRVTFHLRDASYSNGDPVVAEDFAYSWRRLLDPRLGSDFAYLLADLVGAEDLLALAPDALPPDAVIEDMLTALGVSAVDRSTLVADLARPA